VAVLEHENSLLRAALKLPPSDRPLLGRGPTGKEKPKSLFASDSPDSHIIDTIRRASVSTVSTEASQTRSPPNAHPFMHGDQSFDFPQWENALMIHHEVPDSESSPQVEGQPPPSLKLSPVSFYNHHSLPLRDGGGGISPGPVHSRSNSYSQSSSSSSTGPETFSPVYMLSDMPEHSPTMNYSQNPTPPSNHHLCAPSTESFSHFQYPVTSPSSTGAATQQSSPYLSRRESDQILNISYSRHSPPHTTRTGALDTPSNNGHRRAITEPQTLRALVNGDYAGSRGNPTAPIPSHPIRVPSPPPVGFDREVISRKYSLA